jgi:hypothetical protein
VHKQLASSAIKSGGGTVGCQCMGPGDDSHYCQYLESIETIGHQVDEDDNDEDNIVANQPGSGQESTGDDESEDFVFYQVEEEREAPAPLIHHNFDNDDDDQPFSMDLTEEERQHARDFHNGVGFTAV